jgi:cytochrome c-type biogenesis protein CcmH
MIALNSTLKASAFLCLLLLAPLVFAKEATSMAVDPEMEKIVNEISAELRCLVCQNQTIADSSAGLAVDLKKEEIVDYMVKRYGDFVLYRPPVKSTTILLWAGPFLLLFIGLTILVLNLRKRLTLVKDDGELSSEETERLKTLLEAESVKKDPPQQPSQQNEENKS